MDCPDPAVIAATESLESNPVVAEHLKECPSCRLDWQIVHGARRALYGPGEVQHALNDMAMARIRRRARDLQRAPTRWENAGAGVLVAGAVAGMLLLTGPTFSPPILPAAIAILASGIVAVLVFQKRVPAYLFGRDSGSIPE